MAAFTAALLPAEALAQRVVFVARHAEKESEGSEKEIPLSAAGRQRAARLAGLFRSV